MMCCPLCICNITMRIHNGTEESIKYSFRRYAILIFHPCYEYIRFLKLGYSEWMLSEIKQHIPVLHWIVYLKYTYISLRVEPGNLRQCSDGLWTRRPTNWGSIPDRNKRFFSLFHNVQTGSGAHPASYPVGSRGSLLGAKAAKA
jgi:hypothetical protein